jgi:hypothetical protein
MGEAEVTDSTEQEPPCAGSEDPDGPELSPFEGEDMLDYQIQPLRWKYDLAVKKPEVEVNFSPALKFEWSNGTAALCAR